MTRSVGGRKPPASASGPALTGLRAYFKQSELPLTSLLFLLPLIVLYELAGGEQRIIASDLMRYFFQLFGATARFLPPLAVVGILLTWHIARGDPWRLHPGTATGMGFESLALALPLLAMSSLLYRWMAGPLLQGGNAIGYRELAILSLGAGVYEELVFRLAAFTCLNMVLVDLLKIQKRSAWALILISSAILFSLYHYLGAEIFDWRKFVFRTVAGLYFGILFLLRGFGITAGCHAAYDLLVVVLLMRSDI